MLTARSVALGVEVWTGHGYITVTASTIGRAERRVPLARHKSCSSRALAPPSLLKQHGIEPVIDLPGVGANLQDHLQIRSVFKVQGVDTLNTLASSWWGKAKIGLEYAFKRSGPMSMAPSQLGAFTRSSPDQPYPNIEYHVQPLSLDAFGEPLHSFPPSLPACAT